MLATCFDISINVGILIGYLVGYLVNMVQNVSNGFKVLCDMCGACLVHVLMDQGAACP